MFTAFPQHSFISVKTVDTILTHKLQNKSMNFYQIMRVMKITMVLMTCFLVQLSATTLAQKLTIRKQAHHIVDVLKEIRRQSNYDFIYDANALRGLPKVHLEVTNAPIEEVLNQTFKGLPLDYSILSNVVTIRKSTLKVQQTAIAQQLTVRGRVLDGSNRRALQGVSIRIKNSNIGTTTNQNGEFSIQVPSAGQYLIFSFLGYQDQEVQINAEYPNLVIELKPRSDKIEEVRVTVQARVKANTNIAVLEERKKAAIVQDAISAEQIERTASITTTQALQRVTGVTVTDDKFIAVRGLGDRSVIGQLNGARLASSDPDRSAIPLDLVPASLLDNITVYKTVTPDKPADAASGIVELKTKSVPDKLTVEFIAQTGTNSNVGMGGRFNSFWNSNMGLLGTRINNKNLKSDFLNLSKEYPEGLGSIQEMVANSNQTEYGYREVTTIKDTRSDDRAPEWYFSNYRSRTVREFKYMSAIGLTGVSGTYCQLETYVPWSDASGGSVIQTATVNNRIFKRHGSTTAWTAWTEIENVTGSQSRADGALNEAKSYTNAQISVTNGAIALKADRSVTDGLNSRLSSAEQKITPTAIISTVRDSTIEIAGQAVKDIKIGGRNYLLGTSGTTPGGIAASGITMTKNTDGSYTIVAQTVNSNYAQMPYTYADAFAEDVKVGDTITFSCDVKVVSGSSLPSMYFNGSNSYIKMEGEVSSNSFKRVSLTRTLVTTANPVTIHLGFQNAPGTFVIRNFKIEKGNKATEWSAAPEDLEGEISDIGTRITNAESSITQQAGLIATKVGQTEVTASINGAVANIQVGGRNIIRLSNSGSQFFGGYMGSTLSKINNSVSVPEWGATDANRVVSSGGTNTLKATYAILAPKTGETLSISGWFMNNSTTDDLVIHSNLGARTETLGPGVAKRVVFEAIEGNSYESVQFQARSTDPSNNVDFTWWRLQAEKGNKATDWSPAPEDADAEITGLKTRVSSAETTITQNTDAINLRATKSEVTTQVNSARTDAINTASSDATAKANSAQNNAVSSAKTYTDGQVTITNTAINLKAVKSITDGLTTRMNSAEAKITADAINLTVKAQTQAIANQASAQTFANGRMLYTDPAFVSGANGMVQYPSTVGTTMTRVNDQTDSPTKNNIAYKFLHTAMADSNRCSLVRWANQSRANAVFVTRIVAKLPVGWRIQDAHNSYGDSANRSVTWLTPTLGTGMYEEYVLKLVCGNTGTFSSINHFDLRKVDASTPTPTAANPIESYIAWATVYKAILLGQRYMICPRYTTNLMRRRSRLE